MTTSTFMGISPGMRSLDAFFTRSVVRYPDQPALFASGRYWSYKGLDRECGKIERTLHELGLAGKERNIGLIYGREAFSYAAVIAIMRSGNVYVPLNAKMPAEKLLRIVSDAGIDTLIVDSSEALSQGVVGMLREAGSLQIVSQHSGPDSSLDSALSGTLHHLRLVSDEDVAGEWSPCTLAQRSSPRLAYIIYTSGTTGIPKGVPITHESAHRCIEKAYALFETCERDRFTEFSALSFDVSILDLFLCWKSGASLHVASVSESLVPLAFAVRQKISVWSSVPSLANFLLKLGLLKQNALVDIRRFLFCGEALPVELAHACVMAAPRSRVFNLYGPTECTIFATCHEFDPRCDSRHSVVPIGTPLPGLRHTIFDEGRLVEAENEPGELWLAGDQLSQGYWNNPAVTGKAFVRAPSDAPSGETWYRTGDLVSYNSSVGLSFRGRLDRQVKLRGYRVELQEIEAIVRDVIGCTLVAVVPVRSSGGICEKIIAYCDELKGDETTIKSRCANRMAHYMVPERIFRLETFPVSDNGKLDYLALSALAAQSGQAGAADDERLSA